MAKRKRNIGQEILDGLREIKSSKHGRVINFPQENSKYRHSGRGFFRIRDPE